MRLKKRSDDIKPQSNQMQVYTTCPMVDVNE